MMAIKRRADIPLPQHRDHSRHWRENLYVYPVISRRSAGLSIGINLNPDMACNFDCVYCQVDRSATPRTRGVDLNILREELSHMIDEAVSGRLFRDHAFASVPENLRAVKDIAFSGDGEPTTCKVFGESVQITVDAKRAAGLAQVKIVLITDACYLSKPAVVDALAVMDENNGEIWAKLDAGTEDYYRRINRPNFPLQHVIDNIIAAAKVRPLVIQAMFMRLEGAAPDDDELTAFTARLNDILQAGGQIKLVQVYTVARKPAEASVSPLSREELDHIVDLVRRETGLAAVPY
jgi:wyosine [tRNA(Phe)-imidazoG37] synthetase (radical SAM superfamily)